MIDVDYIIHGDFLLTMTPEEDPLHGGAVAISANVIVDVDYLGNLTERYRPREIIGGEGKIVFPGLINTHTHAAMVYFRGLADDLPLREWLEGYIWPAEERWLNHEFISDAVELACLEMLRGGITTYNDMYFFEDTGAETAKSMGMRAVLGAGVLDFPSVGGVSLEDYLMKAERFIKNWYDDELIAPAIAPHAQYTCGPEAYKRAKKMAEKYDVPLHTHVAETEWEVNEIRKRYGKSPVEHLQSMGVLDEGVLAAHCVWLSDSEIDMLARSGAGVSHCIESNLKLASGISPVVKMLKEGIRVSFGTDGAASNNDLDILSEMSTAAKLHKVVSGDSTALKARQVVEMATRSGAGVLGLGEKIGTLAKGKRADVVVADIAKPHLIPLYEVYSHMVYSMKASDVEHVMVNGALLIKDGHYLKRSEEEIMEKAVRWSKKIGG